MDSRLSVGELCRLLIKHAAFTLGGGTVTAVVLERDLVDNGKWLTRDRFRTIYGLARLTPGTNLLALTTGLGWHFFRWPGAALGLACAAIPGSIIAVMFAAGYQQVQQNEMVQRFVAGAAVAVCGFIAAGNLKLIQPYFVAGERLRTSIIFIAVLALSLWGLSPFPVFAGIGVLGYLMPPGEGK